MVPCILELETIMPVLRLRTISIFVNRHHALGAPNQTLPLGTEGDMPCDMPSSMYRSMLSFVFL